MDTENAQPLDECGKTHWSQVLKARDWERTAGREALDRLIEAYEKPLLKFLEWRFKATEDQAREWLQAFIVDRILEKNLLRKADPRLGRFRSLLYAALQNFVLNELRHDRRQETFLTDDLNTQRASGAVELPHEIDVGWAQEVLRKALTRLKEAYETEKRLDLWSIFQRRIVQPALTGSDVPAIAELADSCGFESAPKASAGLVTAQRRFRTILRTVVAEYAGEAEEVEAELRELISILEIGEGFKSWPFPA